jgi:hypothetical protein
MLRGRCKRNQFSKNVITSDLKEDAGPKRCRRQEIADALISNPLESVLDL